VNLLLTTWKFIRIVNGLSLSGVRGAYGGSIPSTPVKILCGFNKIIWRVAK
jgi:hypothetical protein